MANVKISQLPVITSVVDADGIIVNKFNGVTFDTSQTSYANFKTGLFPVTTKGDLFGFSTVPARVPVGVDGQALISDSIASTGLSWKTFTTSDIPEGTNLYFTQARVLATLLTGFSPSNVAILATDTVLQAFGKAQGQITSITASYVVSVFGRTGVVTAQSGDYNTSQVTENTNLYFTEARVRTSVLTGFTPNNAAILATDNVLQAFGKAQGQLNSLVTGVSSVFGRTGAVVAQNADYDTSLVPENTNLYFTESRVRTTVLTGFSPSNAAIVATDSVLIGFNKTQGQINNLVTGVSSVFGRTGAVTAQSGDYNTSQVTENTNLYYTDARVRAAVLTGFAATNAAILDTDSVLTGFNKAQGQLNALVTGVSSVFGRSGAVVATSGDYNTSQVTENTNLYFTTARVLATALTGFSATNAVITATDTVLQAFGKAQGQINALVTGVSSVFGRTGAVVAVAGDYTQNQITGLHTTDSVVFNNLTLTTSVSVTTSVILAQTTTPSPVVSSGQLYTLSDDNAYYLNSAGTEGKLATSRGDTLLGAAPAPLGTLPDNSCNMWLDEPNRLLTFQVAFSGGTIRNGTILLT